MLLAAAIVALSLLLFKSRKSTPASNSTNTQSIQDAQSTNGGEDQKVDTTETIADDSHIYTGQGYKIALPSYMQQDFSQSTDSYQGFSTSTSASLDVPILLVGVQNFTGEGKTGSTSQIQRDLADLMIDKYLGTEGPTAATFPVSGAKEDAFTYGLKHSKFEEGSGVSSVSVIVAARQSGGYVGVTVVFPADPPNSDSYVNDIGKIFDSLTITD